MGKRKPKKKTKKRSRKPAASPYSFKVAGWKLCIKSAQIGAAYAAAHYMVDVDPEALALVLWGLAESARNALKVNYPKSFGWL